MRQPRPKMTEYRKKHGISLMAMAKKCQCTETLLGGIEFSGWITQPSIASRIAHEYKLDVDGYNDLVSKSHRAEVLPERKEPPTCKDIYKATMDH